MIRHCIKFRETTHIKFSLAKIPKIRILTKAKKYEYVLSFITNAISFGKMAMSVNQTTANSNFLGHMCLLIPKCLFTEPVRFPIY